MYERYATLRDKKGLKDSDVARETGITKSTFSDWKAGKYTPKNDKLLKIASFLGVSIDYLMTGEQNDGKYYLNKDAGEAAQFLFENPEYKVLFDASRNVKKEDIDFVAEMIKRMSSSNSDDTEC